MWPFGKSTAERVKDAFNEQPRLKDLGLQVQERGGAVTVTGMVPNQRYLPLVRVVAEGINGVKSVDVSGVTFEQAAQPVTPVAPSAPATVPSADAASLPEIEPTSQPQDVVPAGEMDVEIEDSSRVAKAVLQALRGNGELADDPIDVLQSGRTVILRGVVDSDHEQRLAEKLARAVPGVAGVDVSGLRVAAGVKELAREKDQDSGETVYTVKAGDTLSAIAQRYYGDAAEYRKIAHHNNISDPDLIQVGQKLRIPG
ncbi:BON domain-containing protein [Deinococcus taeanensis]|uniref:BON domain-containing protein n=1 Tax=Deinococcus taeanensis TaxID=2737050 RepID=UPI001CDC1F18|nr:BON domain-containing protein [Deinococcus taeanensis]UBV43342.1 BON domain-containing protein [Deinococcus taeanensis]